MKVNYLTYSYFNFTSFKYIFISSGFFNKKLLKLALIISKPLII